MEPVLAADAVRIDVAGVPAVDGMSLACGGDRVLVLGAARALFEAAAGLRPTARGELRVEGLPPAAAVRGGVAAGAPLDPPVPGDWTVRRYVLWSARLAGHARQAAEALAEDAIARVKLGEAAAEGRLGPSAPAVRRATVLAAALATGARTLLVEDPSTGLDDVARPFAHVVAHALRDRRVVFFAGRIPLDSPIALAADEAVVVDGSHVAAQGPPAELAAAERTFVLCVGGDVRAFAGAVEAHGGRLLGPPPGPAPATLSVELGPLGTCDLIRLAVASNAVVFELRPIAGAFA